MKWLDSYRMRLVVVGVVAAIILSSGGRANADFVFGEPVNLGPVVNSTSFDAAPCISADGMALYLASTRPGGLGYEDLWVSTRQHRSYHQFISLRRCGPKSLLRWPPIGLPFYSAAGREGRSVYVYPTVHRRPLGYASEYGADRQ